MSQLTVTKESSDDAQGIFAFMFECMEDKPRQSDNAEVDASERQNGHRDPAPSVPNKCPMSVQRALPFMIERGEVVQFRTSLSRCDCAERRQALSDLIARNYGIVPSAFETYMRIAESSSAA